MTGKRDGKGKVPWKFYPGPPESLSQGELSLGQSSGEFPDGN